ncbi:glycosyltransferase involved in cell wall biosynthesis [Leifsonia sp. EB41]|uniref:glycosyltransferase n=1 Tax=Leifsonia sp. EB41 TaxID=3156260 RepID=UPI003519A5AD
MKITYLRVEDRAYPRNERVRAALLAAGHEVRVVDRVTDGPKPVRLLRDLWRSFTAGRGSDAVIVPEFSLPFVPAAWVVARLNRALLVVDGFVGKYETVIEDWARASPRSITALGCRVVDRVARTLSDVFLIDTDQRAQAIRDRVPGTQVMTLPVGSPQWVLPEPPPPSGDGLRVLYSGGMLPLHGVPFVMKALARTDPSITLTLVIAAAPERMAELHSSIDTLGLAGRCHFVSWLTHEELIRTVHRHDVVLGVFGDSPKARSVLANKLWQGLAAGRTVVTRSSPALEEIVGVAGELLIAIDDEAALARTLDDLHAHRNRLPYDPEIADRLEDYVRRRFDEFLAVIAERRSRTTPRTRR